MEIQQVLIDKLKPWEKNPRINDNAVDAVARSIETFGFNVPIIFDQHMTIVAGHVRWKAAKKLGLTIVPGIQLSLTNAQREAEWINPKHLHPARGKWSIRGTEVRFWDLDEKKADTLIKRMINCLECGFCVVECFRGRRFDRESKTLRIDGCVQCGRCLRLTSCMGWRHRFWRRVIVEGKWHVS